MKFFSAVLEKWESLQIPSKCLRNYATASTSFIYTNTHIDTFTHLKVYQVFELREAQQGDEEIKPLFLMETKLHMCISFLCNQNHVSEINDWNYNF